MDLHKTNKTNAMSKICSDWWELTEEENYSLVKFEKVIKDEKL